MSSSEEWHLKITHFHFHFYIVLAYLMLFAALTNSVCLNNASLLFSFFYIFFMKGYELSGEIALKNNHYYYSLLLLLGMWLYCRFLNTKVDSS